MTILSSGERGKVALLLSKQSGMGRLPCRLLSSQPNRAQGPKPGPSTEASDAEHPTHLAVQPQGSSEEVNARTGTSLREPLQPFHPENFLGKSVPLAIWEMQPTARGDNAPHLATTVPPTHSSEGSRECSIDSWREVLL